MASRLVVRPLYDVTDAAVFGTWLRQQPPDYIRYFHPFEFTTGALEACLRSATDDLYLGFFLDKKPAALLLLRGWDEGFDIPMFGVCIDHTLARHGWGKTCVALACSLARERGAKSMRLKVYSENIAAMKLYEGEGFTCLNPELLVGNYLYEKTL